MLRVVENEGGLSFVGKRPIDLAPHNHLRDNPPRLVRRQGKLRAQVLHSDVGEYAARAQHKLLQALCLDGCRERQQGGCVGEDRPEERNLAEAVAAALPVGGAEGRHRGVDEVLVRHRVVQKALPLVAVEEAAVDARLRREPVCPSPVAHLLVEHAVDEEDAVEELHVEVEVRREVDVLDGGLPRRQQEPLERPPDGAVLDDGLGVAGALHRRHGGEADRGAVAQAQLGEEELLRVDAVVAGRPLVGLGDEERREKLAGRLHLAAPEERRRDRREHSVVRHSRAALRLLLGARLSGRGGPSARQRLDLLVAAGRPEQPRRLLDSSVGRVVVDEVEARPERDGREVRGYPRRVGDAAQREDGRGEVSLHERLRRGGGGVVSVVELRVDVR